MFLREVTARTEVLALAQYQELQAAYASVQSRSFLHKVEAKVEIMKQLKEVWKKIVMGFVATIIAFNASMAYGATRSDAEKVAKDMQSKLGTNAIVSIDNFQDSSNGQDLILRIQDKDNPEAKPCFLKIGTKLGVGSVKYTNSAYEGKQGQENSEEFKAAIDHIADQVHQAQAKMMSGKLGPDAIKNLANKAGGNAGKILDEKLSKKTTKTSDHQSTMNQWKTEHEKFRQGK